MIIRPEEPMDYSQIADITYEAFSGWQERPFRGEPGIVDALRSGQYYDPELALVAEDEKTHRIVGHALFSCMPAILLGEERYGAFLAPLTVAPSHQRQGIGRLLLEEGARIAREKGISFILLCGHPNYYRQFGYQPSAFALQGCTVDLSGVPRDPSILERPVRQKDLPWLTRRWKQLHMTDRLAFYPGDLTVQWISHSPHAHASVLIRPDHAARSNDAEILGYVRYTCPDGISVQIKDLVPLEQNAAAMLKTICKDSHPVLPLYAEDAARLGLIASPSLVTFPAFFIRSIADDPLVARYLREAQPGIAVFPPQLDLDV